MKASDRAALWLPSVGGILRIQPDLDGMPSCCRLFGRQRSTLGKLELQLDQVQAGGAFGDRMLNLQTGIHLEKVEPSRSVGEELNGPGPDVSDRLGRFDRSREQLGAHISGAFNQWRRCLFDHLLVAPLDRAFPFANCPHGSVPVGHDLNLDVMPDLQVRLTEHRRVTERRDGFRPCRLELFRQVAQ